MKYVNEIIELLSSENCSITDALFKTKVLAHKLGALEIYDWVNNELNGYPDRKNLPSYRVVPMSIFGSITNGVYHYKQTSLPTRHLPKNVYKALDHSSLPQSIASLEDYAKTDKEINTTIPPEMYGALSNAFGGGYQVQQAWGKIGIGVPKQIVTQVRSRLLDFLLKLSDEFPQDLSEDQVRNQSDGHHIQDLFNQAIFKGDTVINIGDNNTLTITKKVKKGDFDSLARELKDKQISDDDIQDLKSAIERDGKSFDSESKSFGERVNSWIGRVVSKTANTSLAIGAGAGGNLLATAIGAFYGF